MGPLTVPLIAAGTQLASTGASAYATGKMNDKTRSWNSFQTYLANEKEDQNFWRNYKSNIDLWNMQNDKAYQNWQMENEYNSPAAQMARFKAAGLNPHLIYGQNNMGGSVSTGNLQSAGRGNVHKAEWNPRAPTYDFGSGIMSYIDAEQKQAQTDNLKMQKDVLQQDAALRIAQTASTLAGAAKTNQDIQQASELFGYSVDAVKAGTRKTTIETDIALNRNEREAAMNASNIREAAERILNMRGQRMNLELDNELKQKELEWRKLGITPNDNLIFRILGRILGGVDGETVERYKRSWDGEIPQTFKLK